MSEINFTGECFAMGVLSEDDAKDLTGALRLSYHNGDRELFIVGLTVDELQSLPNLLYKTSSINLKIEVKK